MPTKQCTLAKFPNTILDGVLTLSGEQFENGFAIPIEHIGPTVLDLEFANNICVKIEGRGLQVECLGDANLLGDVQTIVEDEQSRAPQRRTVLCGNGASTPPPRGDA